MHKIAKIHAREIVDSRANPTIEVDLTLESGAFGRAAIPSGASTGKHEALELRDGDKSRFLGKGVLSAVNNVNDTIANEVLDVEINSQEELDQMLIDIDGTEHKEKLGANAILGVSLAYAHAVSNEEGRPLFEYIAELYGNDRPSLPRPMFNIMNGGKHANWSTDIQEFMVIFTGMEYVEMFRASCEVFIHLGKILKEKGLSTNIGNEGGYAPGFDSNEQVFEFISEAIKNAGYKLGENVFFALDLAASEFYLADEEMYHLKTEDRKLTKEEWMETVIEWVKKYPFLSIEDPFDEDDWETWVEFTKLIGEEYQIVGDDILVTNIKRIERGIEEKACNSLLVKLNQIGTLTETLQAMKMSEEAGWTNVVSHRSGETEDVTISHLVVGTGAGQLKTGAPSRGERTAKYNELLRISEQLQ